MACPECKGGRTGEISLGVVQSSKDGSWWASCWRASCSANKRLDGLFEPGEKEPLPDISYRGPVAEVPEDIMVWCRKRFPAVLDADFEHMIKYNPERNTLLLPIRNESGITIGFVEKCASPNWGDDCPLTSQGELGWRAKVKTWYHNHEVKDGMSWYTNGGHHALLVEDQLSAIVAFSYVHSPVVCLLGTGFNKQKCAELQQAGITSVTFALDADATGQAFAHAKKWGLAFDHVKVVVLPKDFKDMTEHELLDFQL